jgi:hypothetical protein
MNGLAINITVDSLSDLTSIGSNQYMLIVKVVNSSGNPLGNPNIADSNNVIVATTSTSFTATIPVIDGNWTIPNFGLKVYNNDDEDCCFAEKFGLSVTNTEAGQGTGNNEIMISGYYAA